ncbi:uncharacterized protein LACBIDRAFT_324686 [Laccaria bicolor S238N-H82]|uniref:Predicted protein n=1 Tax=Laccaria bicolor (strain S238N-H82 / ATCC MYA-4686) TaxID=486041 RepID=B0D2Q2_LACBS|nr:uncharacterized protein LACBIDRAFT_324686 [Laccaria bicolor S238N-H82]EDR11133.1 predicted protein [Laccaria bicolor S238N-H82]|eukprot:XP_001878434.1 predicted protein [Laccaria bicolor S238N-H82]
MWILGPTAGGQSGQKVTKFETAQSQSPDKIDEMSKKKPPSRYLGIIARSSPDKFGAEASGQKPNFRDQAFSAIARGPPTVKCPGGVYVEWEIMETVFRQLHFRKLMVNFTQGHYHAHIYATSGFVDGGGTASALPSTARRKELACIIERKACLDVIVAKGGERFPHYFFEAFALWLTFKARIDSVIQHPPNGYEPKKDGKIHCLGKSAFLERDMLRRANPEIIYNDRKYYYFVDRGVTWIGTYPVIFGCSKIESAWVYEVYE